MSIADKITRLQTAKTNIATAITNKGGIVSSGDGFEDFSSDIATIQTGITPTGTISITSNGTHDVTNYASALVNVPIGASNFKQWDITIASIITASTVILTDDFFVNHFSEQNLTVVILPKALIYSSAGKISGFCSNRALEASSGGIKGYGALNTTGGSSLGAIIQTTALNNSGISIGGGIYCKNNGQLKLYGGNWLAGDYLVTAFY